jgi:hypothetical protein
VSQQIQEPDDAPAVQPDPQPVPQPRTEPDTEKIDPDQVRDVAPEPEPPAPAPGDSKTAPKSTQELGAEAEIRRIRASAESVKPKGRVKPRHKRHPHWLLRLLPLLVGIIIAFFVGWLIWSLIDDGDMDDNGYTVAPTDPQALDPLEQAARQLLPLDDLERNDRTWYFNKVCTFQKWDGASHNFALVKCGDNPKTLRVATIKLVPVEQRNAIAVT